jgi:membrane protease YdiL (CAAX protease family)
MKFSYALILAFVLALAAAIAISPIAAVALSAAGFRFPFPRIFDRTVMATLLATLILFARPLRMRSLLARGFRDPGSNWADVLRGLAAATVVIALLFACAALVGAHGGPGLERLRDRFPGYLLQAVVVGIIEEGFFRAFLMGGMTADLGRRGGLIVSSAIYAVSHLLRSPARLYLTGFHPAAGLHNLAGSATQLSDPGTAVPALIGLFLLGLVLGGAFLHTGTVYLSIGLHAGFVIGAKSWPAMLTPGIVLPHWIAGVGRFPLISSPAAWIAALILLAILPKLANAERAPNTRSGQLTA